MANWIGVITNAGNSLLNEWVNEKALNFDSAAAGQGIVAEAAMLAQTTLVGQKQTASLLGGERVSAGIRLKLRITAPDTAYTLNQYGVWASVEGGTPAMVALFQHHQGVPIPSKAESPDFVYTFYGLIMCSNTGTWTVTVDTSAVVTVEDLEEAVAGKADQLALAAHEADGVKHVSAAERTAWNAKADGAATSAHIANTNNPHGVTAAQVGAVPLSGGTLTGNLDIAKTIASVVLRTGDSSNRLSGRLMKNANVEGTVDDGLYLTDYGADGSEATLKIQGGQQRLRIKLGGTDYAVYHEGSKPTPADIGAARLICGSYIGTGTAGVSNPCSITFEAAPKLIYLLGSKKPNGVFTWYSLKDHSDSSGHYLWGIYMGALTTVYTENTGFLTDSTELGATSYGKKSSDGKTYYWYVDMASLSSSQQAYGPGLQCNVSGNTYYYAALC